MNEIVAKFRQQIGLHKFATFNRAIEDARAAGDPGVLLDKLWPEITAAISAAGYAIVPKEPTEAMVEAGNDVCEYNVSRLVWERMIDAALSPSPDPAASP